MDELIRQVLVTAAGMWQARWWGLAAAWIFGIAGGVGVMTIPDKYEAVARVYVDTQSVLKPLMAGLAVHPDIDLQVSILGRTLISRPNVEKLIRMADLDLTARTKEDKERLIDKLMRTLEIRTSGRDNIYVLAYRDTQPDKAQRVVQSLVSLFVESGIGSKQKDEASARKFIESQISAYERRLEEAEDRLKAFKLRNMSTMEEGKTYFSRIAEVNAKLRDARLELSEAEHSRDVLKRELAGEEPILVPETQDVAGAVAIPEIDARIDALKRNLDNLLLRYTDAHPEVAGTKKIIAQLEEQKRDEVKSRLKAGAGKATRQPVNLDPALQQLKASLTEADANVAALRARVAEYEARFAQLKNTARMQPEVEAEFTQLNRDYDIQKRNYEALVSRRESAAMSEQMESSNGVADFRMIDPPRVSPQPVAPNRVMMLATVFLASLGGGLAITLLISQIRPSFVDGRTLREVSGRPVLGSVSLLKSDATRRADRRSLTAFLTGTGGLITSYGAALVMLWLNTTRGV